MKKNISFESAMKKLEQIVDEIENNSTELERSMAMYEEGVKLVKICSDKLEEAKKKVEILQKIDGKLKPVPFDGIINPEKANGI